MKSLAFIALSVIASAVMAAGPAPSSSNPEIKITGNSTQTVSMSAAHANNKASGTDSQALQNLASNAGDVTIGGNSTQSMTATWGSSVLNESSGTDSYASQNVSSNLGDVAITGNSTQTTTLAYSTLSNLAAGTNSKAVQNVASNNACVSCLPSNHGGGGWGN